MFISHRIVEIYLLIAYQFIVGRAAYLAESGCGIYGAGVHATLLDTCINTSKYAANIYRYLRTLNGYIEIQLETYYPINGIPDITCMGSPQTVASSLVRFRAACDTGSSSSYAILDMIPSTGGANGALLDLWFYNDQDCGLITEFFVSPESICVFGTLEYTCTSSSFALKQYQYNGCQGTSFGPFTATEVIGVCYPQMRGISRKVFCLPPSVSIPTTKTSSRPSSRRQSLKPTFKISLPPRRPSTRPTARPSVKTSTKPSLKPSRLPTAKPTIKVTKRPSFTLSSKPSM